MGWFNHQLVVKIVKSEKIDGSKTQKTPKKIPPLFQLEKFSKNRDISTQRFSPTFSQNGHLSFQQVQTLQAEIEQLKVGETKKPGVFNEKKRRIGFCFFFSRRMDSWEVFFWLRSSLFLFVNSNFVYDYSL